MLDKVRLVYSQLSDTVYMARFGKRDNVALEKRDALRDIHEVLVQYMTNGMPKGSSQRFHIGEQEYDITLKLVSKEGGA